MEDLVGGGRSLGNRYIRGADRFGSCRSRRIDYIATLTSVVSPIERCVVWRVVQRLAIERRGIMAINGTENPFSRLGMVKRCISASMTMEELPAAAS